MQQNDSAQCYPGIMSSRTAGGDMAGSLTTSCARLLDTLGELNATANRISERLVGPQPCEGSLDKQTPPLGLIDFVARAQCAVELLTVKLQSSLKTLGE